ncbi:MAG: hypothetical protein KBE09_00315 [Candidatus Pacebacteria bacterium]|nr:hypothetical protein [Candidatus Paceibacterota bacterium]
MRWLQRMTRLMRAPSLEEMVVDMPIQSSLDTSSDRDSAIVFIRKFIFRENTRCFEERDRSVAERDAMLAWLKSRRASGGFVGRRVKKRRNKYERLLPPLRAKILKLDEECAAITERVSLGDATYEQLLLIPRVLRVYASGDSALHVETDYLYGDDGAYWWRIGRFRITVAQNGELWWQNLDRHDANHWHAPQIALHGKVGCFGDVAGRIVSQSLGTKNLPVLVSLAVRFPECFKQGVSAPPGPWRKVARTEIPEWYRQ